MNNEPLAPIFLDNKPVVLKDPKPKVSTVLSAGGQAGATEVKWLQTQTGTQGTFLRPDHTLDRTSEPTKAIYLTSLVRGPSIVDEDVVARPFPAKGGMTTTPWSTPAKATPSDAADDEAKAAATAAADDDSMDEDASDDDATGDDDRLDDERSAGTKSGE